jgi:hypothetical protein
VLLYLGRTDEAWSVLDGYLQRHPQDPGGVVTSMRAIWLAKAEAESQRGLPMFGTKFSW